MLCIYFKVFNLSAKEDFIENAKNGKILTRQCTECNELHLATVYFCKKCGNKDFQNRSLDGIGKIVTYTIMTVPPEGFEQYSPYAWAVMELNDSDVRISGFLPDIGKPEDLPVGTPAKTVSYTHLTLPTICSV